MRNDELQSFTNKHIRYYLRKSGENKVNCDTKTHWSNQGLFPSNLNGWNICLYPESGDKKKQL